jgi:hypothetical protein
MALTESERETIIGMCDADNMATIYTAQKPLITKLNKNPAAVLLAAGNDGGTAWARYRLPAHLISVRKPTTLTQEQRDQRSETMRQTRARQLEGQEKLFD